MPRWLHVWLTVFEIHEGYYTLISMEVKGDQVGRKAMERDLSLKCKLKLRMKEKRGVP
jgi:hypothetical protein